MEPVEPDSLSQTGRHLQDSKRNYTRLYDLRLINVAVDLEL